MATRVFYPVFLDIAGKQAIVVGAGKVGLRKARGLVEAGARVRVISPAFDPAFDELPVERVIREYRSGDLDGVFLAFAATNQRAVNRQIFEHASALGIPVNVADAPAECAFIVPARLHAGDIQIAISTGGVDPRAAAAARRKIEKCLAPEEQSRPI